MISSLGMTSSSFAWCSDTKQIFELDILGLENLDAACVQSLGRVLIMSFCIKDSVVSFIEKDLINSILIIWICINTVFFPIYCVILIILQKRVFGSDDRGWGPPHTAKWCTEQEPWNFHQLGFVQVTSTGIVKIMFEYSVISSLLQNSRAFSTSRILDARTIQ
jgi:hypothetical protein